MISDSFEQALGFGRIVKRQTVLSIMIARALAVLLVCSLAAMSLANVHFFFNLPFLK
jgi:hypothetical protein